ncbi:DUF4129 domain-containing protein [Larkinella insperata]|uniref:DUF4129 domain-containing protein n=1 Tax=Larkinella insperata TaxID=332158 RepID=A0ABW3QNQ3_9BACT|nr:DUF4129 domain-containing protein [Larkinella insperata]
MKVIINRMAVWWLFGWLLALTITGFSAAAQLPVPQPKGTAQAQPAPDDRSAVRVRRPAADRIDEYRNDREYQYGQDFKPTNSLWSKFWSWFWQKVGAFFTSRAYENFWQYVILATIAGGAIWLLIKAEVLGFVFSPKARSVAFPYEAVTENIHEIDFEQQIDAAIQQRNYRLAVRLLYLQTLKHLSNRNLIDWKPDKTNRSYVYELAQSPLQPDFETLTTQFEYIWYGDFPITEERFKPLQESFVRFNR